VVPVPKPEVLYENRCIVSIVVMKATSDITAQVGGCQRTEY
jgi:hypothetical protein